MSGFSPIARAQSRGCRLLHEYRRRHVRRVEPIRDGAFSSVFAELADNFIGIRQRAVRSQSTHVVQLQHRPPPPLRAVLKTGSRRGGQLLHRAEHSFGPHKAGPRPGIAAGVAISNVSVRSHRGRLSTVSSAYEDMFPDVGAEPSGPRGRLSRAVNLERLVDPAECRR